MKEVAERSLRGYRKYRPRIEFQKSQLALALELPSPAERGIASDNEVGFLERMKAQGWYKILKDYSTPLGIIFSTLIAALFLTMLASRFLKVEKQKVTAMETQAEASMTVTAAAGSGGGGGPVASGGDAGGGGGGGTAVVSGAVDASGEIPKSFQHFSQLTKDNPSHAAMLVKQWLRSRSREAFGHSYLYSEISGS